MLRGLPFLQESLAAVRHHHERWDGTGYPDRLKGDAIPLIVRILSVADVFDATRSKRPYRTGESLHFARQVIKAGATTQLDARVHSRTRCTRTYLAPRRAAAQPGVFGPTR